MASKSYTTLHNGAKMPLLGYGTWQAAPGELEGPLNAALEAGYRHIDTAAAYHNEDTIGKVLNEWISAGKLKREDLFITTKLPAGGIRPGGPKKWLASSLQKLGLAYVDLYLVHCAYGTKDQGEEPFPLDADGHIHFDPETDHVTIWKEMEALVQAGQTKAIGVSNFNKSLIQKVTKGGKIKPANLQVEMHVYMQQKPLVDWCHKNGITVTAYSPLGSPGSTAFVEYLGNRIKLPDLISNPTVVEVAKRHGKQPGQVLLKHIVQMGVSAIPKSLSKERLAQNIALFDWELTKDDVAKLNALDQGNAGRIFNAKFWGVEESDPTYPFDEYP